MNIQIFGTKKCFETKKAERFFKERNIKFQFIDLKEKEISKGEFKSIASSIPINELINIKSKDYEKLNLDKIRSTETKLEIIFKNQQIIKTPIVRNGKKAVVGYNVDVWNIWINEK